MIIKFVISRLIRHICVLYYVYNIIKNIFIFIIIYYIIIIKNTWLYHINYMVSYTIIIHI